MLLLLLLTFLFHFRFHNELTEPSLDKAVIPCIRDDVQLSVEIYRNKLYELIASRKSNRVRNESQNISGRRLSASGSSFLNGYTNSSSHATTSPSHNNKNYYNEKNSYKSSGHYREDLRSRTRNRNSSSTSNHSKSIYAEDYSATTNNGNSLKPKNHYELSQPVKVTVVAKNFDKQKSRGLDITSKNTQFSRIKSKYEEPVIAPVEPASSCGISVRPEEYSKGAFGYASCVSGNLLILENA